MNAVKFPAALQQRRKFKKLRPTFKLDALFPPCASLSGSFTPPGNISKDSTLPPTFKIDPQSYVASVRTTIGSMRVLNFPAVSKKGDHRVLATIVCGNRRSAAPRNLLFLSAQRTCKHITTSLFQTHFPYKNTTYLFQIVHSGIFSLSTFFPLSRSTVRPASSSTLAPPRCLPHGGGRGLRNGVVQLCAVRGFSRDSFITAVMFLCECRTE